MNRIILLISILFLLVGCDFTPNKEYHKLKDGKGYCYQDDDLIWHLYAYDQLTGQYQYTTSTVTPTYDSEIATDFTPTSESVSNFSESPDYGMSESTGTDTGGSSESNDSDGGGMSENSGSDSGGSDGGGSDSGGDGGGGE